MDGYPSSCAAAAHATAGSPVSARGHQHAAAGNAVRNEPDAAARSAAILTRPCAGRCHADVAGHRQGLGGIDDYRASASACRG